MKLIGARPVFHLEAGLVRWAIPCDAGGRSESVEDDSDAFLPWGLKNDPEGSESWIRPMKNAAARLEKAVDEKVNEGLSV